jgi:hypothetical protein
LAHPDIAADFRHAEFLKLAVCNPLDFPDAQREKCAGRQGVGVRCLLPRDKQPAHDTVLMGLARIETGEAEYWLVGKDLVGG